jgi:hypothetical protein
MYGLLDVGILLNKYPRTKRAIRRHNGKGRPVRRSSKGVWMGLGDGPRGRQTANSWKLVSMERTNQVVQPQKARRVHNIESIQVGMILGHKMRSVSVCNPN